MVELETVQRLASYNKGMSGQALINGNFDVWQRGTSTTTMGFLADKWNEYADANGGTLPTLTRSREVLASGDIPNAFFYSRLTTNGAGSSLGTSSRHWYWQAIENGTRYLCGAGRKVTISFWARSSIANKKISINLIQNYGSGGSPSSDETIVGTNFTLTSTWTKYTHTFDTNTLVNKTFGTDYTTDILIVLFQYMWGSGTYATNAGSAGVAETYRGSGTIDIAQVQLCAGSEALPFDPRTPAEEERLCMRYYEKSGITPIFSGNVNSGVTYYLNVFYKVKKRAAYAPTLTNVGNNGFPTSGSRLTYDVDGFIDSRQCNSTLGGGFYWSSWDVSADL